MVNIKPLLLFAATVFTQISSTSAAPTDAGFSLLYSDLKRLDKSVNVLVATINAFQNGTAQTIPIFDAMSHVNATNRRAYADAMSISPLSAGDSQEIVAYVSDPIAVDIPNGLRALNAKKQALVAAGARQKILDDLNLLVGDHETLSLAIGSKLSPLTILPALDPVVAIDVAIRQAIAYFSLP